jgi:hypothetical protein
MDSRSDHRKTFAIMGQYGKTEMKTAIAVFEQLATVSATRDRLLNDVRQKRGEVTA